MSTSDDRRIPAVTSHRDRHTDAAVTRSEEQLRVTTEIVPVRRIRLRKYLVTEDQTFTVPVTREEIMVDHLDVPEHQRVPDGDGPLTDSEVEVVRYEERVVVTKELVPVERVRLVRRVVTAEQTVAETVRREIVDVDQITTPDSASGTRSGTPSTPPSFGGTETPSF